MAIVYVGIDLAKNVFAVHGVNEAGKPALVRPKVPRAELNALVASLPPCTIAMEACSGAHQWAREFQAHSHTVKLIAPKFVTPYRMSGRKGKNDAADAQAICEAVQRPSMRFVPTKTVEQQGKLMVHRARQGFVQARTAIFNRIRGMLTEVGIVLPLKASTVRRRALELLEDLPGHVNTVVGDLLSEVHHLDERIKAYDRHISPIANQTMRFCGEGTTDARSHEESSG
jgi:transposase